jgi:hypothetical protein
MTQAQAHAQRGWGGAARERKKLNQVRWDAQSKKEEREGGTERGTERGMEIEARRREAEARRERG